MGNTNINKWIINLLPQQGVIGTNIELPKVSLRSAPGYDLAGPSVRMGNPNRSAVTRT